MGVMNGIIVLCIIFIILGKHLITEDTCTKLLRQKMLLTHTNLARYNGFLGIVLKYIQKKISTTLLP